MPKFFCVFAPLLVVLSVPVGAQTIPLDSDAQRPPLEFQRWSGAINVPDPVALSVDKQGRVFVTQTRRRKIQDLDIREHREWIPDDVGLTSVDDKRRFLHETLGIGGDQAKQKLHVADHNGDGEYDWRDLTVVSECIYRLSDDDEDGTADHITVFAEDFKTEVTGIAAGVLAHEDDVWATIAPDLWRLKDTDNDGVADQRQAVVTGFGLHIAYAGHDMHGLTIGPDGKIYWSIGDKGISVTTNDGRKIAYPNQGGVMRCNPDGSDFEVFAHGLRNIQEFAFDRHGNFFGVDNDADQPNERERFVWIVDGMDAGWRCNYQYRGDGYNPWTDERLWQVAGEKHAAYLIPPISHYIDGPAGFKFNPGTALSPEYRDYFFITGAPNGNQHAFRVQRTGDAFEMVDEHKIGSGVAIVGLAFGPDGALYGADWDGGYPLDQKGAVVKIDVPGASGSDIRIAVKKLLADGFGHRAVEDLVTFLSHADQRIRLGAQFALVDQEQTKPLSSVASDTRSTTVARLHAVWGLGQLARAGHRDAHEAIVPLTGDEDPVLRGQVVKTLGEIPGTRGSDLVASVTDQDSHVRIHAGLAIARIGVPEATDVLLRQADQLTHEEHYLRHSIVSALATSATAEQLASQATEPSTMRRMCSVLALRRQRHASVAAFLDDDSAWVATEAARAIHDDESISDAMESLAESLLSFDADDEAFMRRAINANFRLGSETASGRLMTFAKQVERPETLRVAACEAVGLWNDPPLLDRVDGRRRVPVQTRRELDSAYVAESLATLAGDRVAGLQVAALIAARQLGVELPRDALVALVNSGGVPPRLRAEALSSLTEMDAADSWPLLTAAAASPDPELAVTATGLIAKHDSELALSVLESNLRAKSLKVRQAAIAGLATRGTRKADQVLGSLADQAQDESLAAGLRLDLMEAIEARGADSPELAEHEWFVQRDPTKLDPTDADGRFEFSLEGGDVAKGEQLFRTHVQAQCSRCHRIGRRGSEIGPELTKVAKKRDPAYLLRSIVTPSVDIEPKYFTQSILLFSGQVVKGVIASETDDHTVVVTGDGKEIKLANDDIEAVSNQKVSLMPDMTDVLSPRQVRDLVAYLGTLK